MLTIQVLCTQANRYADIRNYLRAASYAALCWNGEGEADENSPSARRVLQEIRRQEGIEGGAMQ